MASKRGKTIGYDKQTGGYKRLPTEDYAFGAEGILVASYRVASRSALGMANAEPLNEDGEGGAITLAASPVGGGANTGEASSYTVAGPLGKSNKRDAGQIPSTGSAAAAT